jgi:hypothetical protein
MRLAGGNVTDTSTDTATVLSINLLGGNPAVKIPAAGRNACATEAAAAAPA